jgi:hypothetical protein
MTRGARGNSKLPYLVTVVMLGLALAFPIALMVFNPTLMFERGWEQYVGTAIYCWAVVTLARELWSLWTNECAFAEAPRWLERITTQRVTDGHDGGGPAIAGDERRILPARLRQLACYVEETRLPSITQLMEFNREGSALDQEQAAGRFTLTRYILYLLPVIGFIGTVEGISKALLNISKVLPMVKELDGFLNNLTGVTSALQIAFDSTLLALFLSAALMLVQTLVFRRSETLLARVDRSSAATIRRWGFWPKPLARNSSSSAARSRRSSSLRLDRSRRSRRGGASASGRRSSSSPSRLIVFPCRCRASSAVRKRSARWGLSSSRWVPQASRSVEARPRSRELRRL